ncbi:MAG TPA: helix-turn-helix domain-containing protein [Myxococcales bacterium]|nr:helix-turn-helix domain-containing protein [Myxococcales bacterium]
MRRQVRGPENAVGPLPRAAPAAGYVGPAGQCGMERALDLVASKWTAPIIHLLHSDQGPVRFRELQRRLGKVTQKELTRHLRQLERCGLVARTIHPEVPPRVEYTLTDLGRTLVPPLQALAVWAEKYGPELDAHEAARRSTSKEATDA